MTPEEIQRLEACYNFLNIQSEGLSERAVDILTEARTTIESEISELGYLVRANIQGFQIVKKVA